MVKPYSVFNTQQKQKFDVTSLTNNDKNSDLEKFRFNASRAKRIFVYPNAPNDAGSVTKHVLQGSARALSGEHLS